MRMHLTLKEIDYRDNVEHLFGATNALFRRQETPRRTLRTKKRGRKFRENTELLCVLLDKNNYSMVPSKLALRKLTAGGLGEKSIWVPRGSSMDDIEDTIRKEFLCLNGYPFRLLKSTEGRKLVTLVPCANVRELKKTIKKGKLYILPRRNIHNPDNSLDDGSDTSLPDPEEANDNVATLQHASSGIESTQNDTGSTTVHMPVTDTVDRDASRSPVPMPVADTEDDMPRMSRQRRRNATRRNAARVARVQIHEWCNRSSPLVETPTPPELDNLGLSVTELRRSQDEAYERSLEIDRKKEEDRKADEHQQAQRQKELDALEQLRTSRRLRLPEEPESGFILKIRGGAKRRFEKSDTSEVLLNFVGSQENASENFIIRLVGNVSVTSWSPVKKLQDIGIEESAVIEVEWDVEKPSDDISSYDQLITSLDNCIEISDEEDNRTCDQLIESLESNVPRNEHDAENLTVLQNELSSSPADISDILRHWRMSTITEGKQALRVTRNPASLFLHALRCYERKSFEASKDLMVVFINEPGQDEGGLKREFFEILNSQILKSSYMEETDQGYIVSHNMVALLEKKYRTIGMIVASMLLHGGPVQPVFHHTMITYGIKGLEAATIDTIEDATKRKMIEQISKDNIDDLKNNEELLDAMEAAGVRLAINNSTRLTIQTALAAFFSDVTKRQPMMDQFWEGAEILGLRSLLKKFTELEGVMCQQCGVLPVLSSNLFMSMINFDRHGEAGSNSRARSEEVIQNLESLVFDLEEGKTSLGSRTFKVGDLLQFLTGCSTIPPGGFENKINVHFTDLDCYPFVSTCSYDLTIPLALTTYTKFKTVFLECMVSGQGFGKV